MVCCWGEECRDSRCWAFVWIRMCRTRIFNTPAFADRISNLNPQTLNTGMQWEDSAAQPLCHPRPGAAGSATWWHGAVPQVWGKVTVPGSAQFVSADSLCLTSEKGFWGNSMGNQGRWSISAGVRSQSSKDVLLLLLSSPWTWYPQQLQLYPIFASWQWEKRTDLIPTDVSSCHPAGKILPSQNKFSKTLVLVALMKCLWSLRLWEMEMQGSAVLTEQLQIYGCTAGMDLREE